MISKNGIFVVAQRTFSAQVEIKIGIRHDEKIRLAQTNSSNGNPPLCTKWIIFYGTFKRAFLTKTRLDFKNKRALTAVR